jgi:hypothetical protein
MSIMDQEAPIRPPSTGRFGCVDIVANIDTIGKSTASTTVVAESFWGPFRELFVPVLFDAYLLGMVGLFVALIVAAVIRHRRGAISYARMRTLVGMSLVWCSFGTFRLARGGLLPSGDGSPFLIDGLAVLLLVGGVGLWFAAYNSRRCA